MSKSLKVAAPLFSKRKMRRFILSCRLNWNMVGRSLYSVGHCLLEAEMERAGVGVSPADREDLGLHSYSCCTVLVYVKIDKRLDLQSVGRGKLTLRDSQIHIVREP